MNSTLGGIVLAGGRSRRMGVAKATLPFGSETLLGRIVRIVGEVCAPVVVVAAADQALPPLPKSVVIARDAQPAHGPLEGFAAGLNSIRETQVVYLSGCDTPLIAPGFIRRMHDLLDAAHDAAVPLLDGLPQPLAGVYRTSVLAAITTLLNEKHLRLLDLLERIRTRHVLADELREIDPQLLSLRNANTPEEYEAALHAGTSSGVHPRWSEDSPNRELPPG